MLFSESIVAQIIIGHGIERWNIVSLVMELKDGI